MQSLPKCEENEKKLTRRREAQKPMLEKTVRLRRGRREADQKMNETVGEACK